MTGPRPVITPQKKIHKTQGPITKSKKIKKKINFKKRNIGERSLSQSRLPRLTRDM